MGPHLGQVEPSLPDYGDWVTQVIEEAFCVALFLFCEGVRLAASNGSGWARLVRRAAGRFVRVGGELADACKALQQVGPTQCAHAPCLVPLKAGGRERLRN